MAIKIGDLFFDVTADVSRAAKSVEGLTDKFKSAGTVAARAIGETVANAAGLAVAGMSALTAATIDAGVAYNVLGQSATAAFTTVYNDLETANQILQEISTLDLETPFRGSSLVRTARTLAGFGVEEENVLRITEALTEAIAGMGLGSAELQRVAIQFGQIASRGRLAGDEARALANYGIDAFGILADALNLPVTKVRELSEEFKLTADVAIPALVAGIEDRFGGATERLFNTAAGQAEGLRAIFEALGSALVSPFIGFSGGGAFVEAMGAIRLQMTQMVSVAEDGAFVFENFLSPLAPILEQIADSVADAGVNFASFLGGLDSSALTAVFADLDGLGPAITAFGAAIAVVFAQSIPFLGRFAAGFNPIVVGISALILSSSSLRSEFGGAFEKIFAAVHPLVPQVKELLTGLIQLANDAGPAIADILVTSVEALVPILGEVLSAVNDLLPVVGPILVVALEALAVALQIIADILELLGPELVTVGIALGTLITLFPVATASVIFATTNMSLLATQTGFAATAFGTLATAVGVALAALGAYQGISSGLTGDIDFLNRDVPFYEKPFQVAGRFGYWMGGGDRELDALTAESNAGIEAAEDFNLALLGQVENFAEAREAAKQYAVGLGLTGDGIENFANLAATAWVELSEAEKQAEAEANRWVTAAGRQHGGLNEIMSGAHGAADSLAGLNLETEDSVDLLKLLTVEARRAWEEVDRLASVGQDAEIDDFLRELPDLARDLTDALAEGPGILRDLEVGSILGDVRGQATKVIQVLAREYGAGMEEIRAMLDQRGLAAVIEALGTITEETTETIDPLIAKYSALGATADQLRDAISRLNDVRQTRIRAEIDQVEAALRDAQEAAQAARGAVEDFLSAGYLNSPQALVDSLIGDIGNIGSTIEDALLQGGVRGEAAIRSALGGLQSQLAGIVNAGMEAGLSGAQIVDLIRPVTSAINEEVREASNRITTLDWTDGITSKSGQELVEALMAGMDPAAIQGLINNILGADASVAGLEAKLESLRASLSAEVEFSPEQVQFALSEIQAETIVTPVITREAARLVYDEIQTLFDDKDLEASIDQALIVQEITDAAQAAEDEINLVFKSGLSFNSAELHEVARLVSEEFFTAFNQKMEELRDEKAREAGFENYTAMQAALGPAVAGATIGGMQVNQTINNDIKVSGPSSALATASEIIAASSAAAGSGGRYDPTKYYKPTLTRAVR